MHSHPAALCQCQTSALHWTMAEVQSLSVVNTRLALCQSLIREIVRFRTSRNLIKLLYCTKLYEHTWTGDSAETEQYVSNVNWNLTWLSQIQATCSQNTMSPGKKMSHCPLRQNACTRTDVPRNQQQLKVTVRLKSSTSMNKPNTAQWPDSCRVMIYRLLMSCVGIHWCSCKLLVLLSQFESCTVQSVKFTKELCLVMFS